MTKIKYIFATFLVLGIFSLPTTSSFAEAIKKPQKPTIEKLVLDDQVYKKENQIDIKDKTISYKLRGSIPEINKFQTYKYVFCDILPNDTSLDKESIKIYLITEKNKTNITNMLHCRYGKLTGNRNTHLMPYLTFIFAMTQKKH